MAKRRSKAQDGNGLLGKKQQSTALDYFTNALARLGYGTPSLPESRAYNLVRLSNNYLLLLTLYRNHWIARRIVDLPAIDMTRAWPKLKSDLSPEEIKKFDRAVQRTYTPRSVRQAIKWGRLYGGAGALIAIDGHEKYLDEPLDLDDVNPGTYRGLIPFDRWVGIYPKGTASNDIEHPLEWGIPELYEVRGSDTSESFNVHSSRILRFLGPEVPTPELQAQVYWGISALEPVWEDLGKRDDASWAILNLIFRANLISQTNPDLAQILSGLGSSAEASRRFHATMEAQNFTLSNQSMLILGKDGKMDAVQYSFAGIGDVYAQFQMDVAGAANIPVTRLFGRTITGLGQSNDADERLYEEMIAAEQNDGLRSQLDKLYPVICMSEFGEVPDDLDFTFPSIRVLSEEDKGDIAEKGSAPVIAAYNSALISRRTALKELRQIGDSTNIFTNITDEDIENAEEEPIDLGEMGEADGPGGGPSRHSKPNPQRVEKQFAAGAEDAESGGRGKRQRLEEELSKVKTRGERQRLEEQIGNLRDADLVRKFLVWRGLDVTIENPKGSTRSGKGGAWTTKMAADYGYIQRTKGDDGDGLDVFVGPSPTATMVYVIRTRKAPEFKEYDEEKCMLDFDDPGDAKTAFLASYDDPKFFGDMVTVEVAEFVSRFPDARSFFPENARR
jgi:phage-related protein (TIGR01555 family)